MPPETSTETVTPPVTVVEPTTQVDTPAVQQVTTPETGGNGVPPVAKPEEQTLPDTHPLVKAFETQKAELKALRAAGQPKDKTVTELATATSELTSTKTELASAQAKYGRLEAFLTSIGGPISKALDSRTFSTALFESDTDITELVAKWHKDNPSATSEALGAGTGTTGPAKDMNALLRSAIK